MAKSIHITLLALFVTLVFSACDDKDSDDPTPSSVGLTGSVRAQNEFGQPLYEERDGVAIHLQVGYRSFDVLADNQGYYDFNGAPIGTYSATYSKPGFGTLINRNLKVSALDPNFQVQNGRQVLPTITLTKIPNTTFSDEALSLSYTVNGNDTAYSLTLSARIVPAPPPTGQAKGFRVFLGTDPLLGPHNYLHQSHHTTLTDTFSLHFNHAFLDSNQIGSGDMIYALLYGDANFDVQQNPMSDEIPPFPNISAEPGSLTSVVLP